MHCSVTLSKTNANSPTPHSSGGCVDDVEVDSRLPGQQLLVARAALTILRDRLNNAYEVTNITFLAARIINDGKVTAHITALINRQLKLTEVAAWSKLLGNRIVECMRRNRTVSTT